MCHNYNQTTDQVMQCFLDLEWRHKATLRPRLITQDLKKPFRFPHPHMHIGDYNAIVHDHDTAPLVIILII